MKNFFTALSSRPALSLQKSLRNDFFPVICFLLAAASVILTLVDTALARNCFFISGYIALVAICIDIRHLRRYPGIISLMLILLALVKVLWFLIFYGDAAVANMYNAYLQAGKRLFFAAAIMMYLMKNSHRIPAKRPLIKITLWLAFLLTSLIGIIQVWHGMDRIEFNNTRSTDASYMYSCISLALAFLVLSQGSVRGYLQAFIIFLCSYWLILHTGTRSAIVLHPLIFLVCLLVNSHSRHKLKVLSVALLTLVCLVFLFRGEVSERVHSTENDLSVYRQSNGNDATSLGTRLAMWQVGLAVFKLHPWGMSTEQRYQYMSTYVAQHGTDKSALDYAMVHLHDESIETASQQGIIGLAVLWAFYLTLFYQAVKCRNTLLLLTLLCLAGYGLTDVPLISREQTIFFGLMITLSCLCAAGGQVQKSQQV